MHHIKEDDKEDKTARQQERTAVFSYAYMRVRDFM